MAPHTDLELTKIIALQFAKKHNMNYTIFILNPNDKGEFDINAGSSYEMVIDTYWEKPRPNTKIVCTTDELLGKL